MKPVILIAGGGTGGHLMPALAIAREIRERGAAEPVLVGATRGVEARLLPERGFRYHLLPAEPVYRRAWWRNVRWPLIAARLMGRLNAVFRAEQPVAVVGTGGYASAPVVWLAARRGIPTAIQEQNAYPGLANRWLARRVDHIYLGLPEAASLLKPGARTRLFETGNPIVPPTPERAPAARARFGITGGKTLLVTGGSQGALALNRAVAGWVDAGLPPGLSVIWVTGPGTYEQFARYHQSPRVHVIPFLDPMADGYAVSDLVVSRAGMITVAELCAWGLPSVLIPLPTAAADHQTHNARAMAQAGAAELLLQSGLTVDSLRATVQGLLVDDRIRGAMAERARERGRPGAVGEIVSHLLTLPSPRRTFSTSSNVLD